MKIVLIFFIAFSIARAYATPKDLIKVSTTGRNSSSILAKVYCRLPLIRQMTAIRDGFRIYSICFIPILKPHVYLINWLRAYCF